MVAKVPPSNSSKEVIGTRVAAIGAWQIIVGGGEPSDCRLKEAENEKNSLL